MKILKRLYFIKYRYEGLSVQESAEIVGTSKQIGYGWQDRWNLEGYEGLKPKYAEGRPSKLSDEQKELLKITLNKKDDWTTEEVRKLILIIIPHRSAAVGCDIAIFDCISFLLP